MRQAMIGLSVAKAGIGDDFVKLWFTLAFEPGMSRGLGFKVLTSDIKK